MLEFESEHFVNHLLGLFVFFAQQLLALEQSLPHLLVLIRDLLELAGVILQLFSILSDHLHIPLDLLLEGLLFLP